MTGKNETVELMRNISDELMNIRVDLDDALNAVIGEAEQEAVKRIIELVSRVGWDAVVEVMNLSNGGYSFPTNAAYPCGSLWDLVSEQSGDLFDWHEGKIPEDRAKKPKSKNRRGTEDLVATSPSPENQNPVTSAAPVNSRSGDAVQVPITLDEWHRALGIRKCLTCSVPLLNGTKYVWQGRNRWCEKCFWGEDSRITLSTSPVPKTRD